MPDAKVTKAFNINRWPSGVTGNTEAAKRWFLVMFRPHVKSAARSLPTAQGLPTPCV